MRCASIRALDNSPRELPIEEFAVASSPFYRRVFIVGFLRSDLPTIYAYLSLIISNFRRELTREKPLRLAGG